MDRRSKALLVAAGLFGLALAAPRPEADIRILAHAKDDLSPSRVKAAVEVGGMAVSVLVTWTADGLRR
jgi:hypothetical protein